MDRLRTGSAIALAAVGSVIHGMTVRANTVSVNDERQAEDVVDNVAGVPPAPRGGDRA